MVAMGELILTVKQARLMKGLTQKQVAEALGVHVQTYQKIEKRPKTATVDQAKIIAELTGFSVDQIFFA